MEGIHKMTVAASRIKNIFERFIFLNSMPTGLKSEMVFLAGYAKISGMLFCWCCRVSSYRICMGFPCFVWYISERTAILITGTAAAKIPPPILILDEPTNGLDPVGIHEIRTLIRSLPEKFNCTVLVSSHLLSEIKRADFSENLHSVFGIPFPVNGKWTACGSGKSEKHFHCGGLSRAVVSSHLLSEIELMADSIGILNQGRLLFEGTLDELKMNADLQGYPTDNLHCRHIRYDIKGRLPLQQAAHSAWPSSANWR